MSTFTPGMQVRAFNEIWIVQQVIQTDDGVRLRAIALDGGNQERTLDPDDGVEPATVAPFDIEHMADQEGAKLLRDALMLSTQCGAGPFRSLGTIAIQPHAYQLVPLMMALSQPVVRLLIADGTGIGKTIEAGLILRELLDRGDIGRFVVLTPPHLVDQWVGELRDKFNLTDAVGITTRSIARIERQVPTGTPLFEHFRQAVVSLDYIKSDKHFAEFKHMCPECVVVDEVHGCVGDGTRNQRYRLLKYLAKEAHRHFIFCSATPHAGDAAGFGRLLALLNPAFNNWDELPEAERARLIPELRKHLVQRVRQDLTGWEEGDARLFPERDMHDAPYELNDASRSFFEAIFAHCKERIEGTTNSDERQRVFWSGMALLGCVSSSPGAALAALTAKPEAAQADAQTTALNAVFEQQDGELAESDVEPRNVLGAKAPRTIIVQAQALVAQGPAGDGKLHRLISEVKACLADGHQPIVFCHFVSTARYVGEQLQHAFPETRIGVVTGTTGNAKEREAAVMSLADAPQRVLVATSCLSEGVNLQSLFDAVIHYDLTWNPMRLQQREGRVDRLGQARPRVLCVTLHGPENPIDAAMLTVLQRKAARIQSDLGVELWLPDQGTEATKQLMGDLLEHGGKALRAHKRLASGSATATSALDADAKKLKAIGVAQRHYAQQHLRPDEVIPEWRKAMAALGSLEDLEAFMVGALGRLKADISRLAPHLFHVRLEGCAPYALKRFKLLDVPLSATLRFSPPGQFLPDTASRGHPVVLALAHLIEDQARNESGDPVIGRLGRSGCWVSKFVHEMTVVALVRLNHQLIADGKTYTVRETSALAWRQNVPDPALTHVAALDLLGRPAASDISHTAKKRCLERGKAMRDERAEDLVAHQKLRAETLLADHVRMRRASHIKAEVSVTPLHLEEMGLYVLLPEG